jgi:hypothetical protein
MAQTRIVTNTPPKIKNKPRVLMAGRALLKNRTMEQQSQVPIR